jgi:hypothetical protein
MREVRSSGLIGMNDPRSVTDPRYVAQISAPKKLENTPSRTRRQSSNTFINELSLDWSRLLFQNNGAEIASHAGINRTYDNANASVTITITNITECFELPWRMIVEPARKSPVAKYRLKKPSLRQNDSRAGLRAKSRPPKIKSAFRYWRNFLGTSFSAKALENEKTIIQIARR